MIWKFCVYVPTFRKGRFTGKAIIAQAALGDGVRELTVILPIDIDWYRPQNTRIYLKIPAKQIDQMQLFLIFAG
jgi:hypothetical protein